MFIVGLTGGIGSGKSTVADCFARLGVPVIDTDVIARELTAPDGAALAPIHTAFGDAVMCADGTLDRVALRRLVFADDAARLQLEAILHPRIRQAVEARLATMDVEVERNAYGRQLGSFRAVAGLEGAGEVPMTFIRAPRRTPKPPSPPSPPCCAWHRTRSAG